METRPLRSIPRELSNLAHTSSIQSLPNPSVAADISFNSQHNQLMARPYHLLSANGGAVGHIYSNDLHNSSMLSHEKHMGSSNAPFISETSVWSPASPSHLLDFALDSPIQNSHMQDGGIVASDDVHKQIDWPLDDELIDWNDLLLDTSSNSASKVCYSSPKLISCDKYCVSCLQILLFFFLSLFSSSISNCRKHHEKTHAL